MRQPSKGDKLYQIKHNGELILGWLRPYPLSFKKRESAISHAEKSLKLKDYRIVKVIFGDGFNGEIVYW